MAPPAPMAAAALLAAVAALGAGCNAEGPRDEGSEATAAPAVRVGGTERPPRLVFGLTPYLQPEDMKQEFTPLVEYVGEQVGIPGVVRVAKTYSELAQLLAAHEVQIAAFAPFSYVRAKRNNPSLILLGTHIADGSSTYSAYIITSADTGIDSIEELRGKRFGFIDRTSASGYLYPIAYLRQLGYEPDAFFSQVEFAGHHSSLIEKVSKGELDAGATFSTAYSNAKDGRLKILAKTGRIPYDAYCANPSLDQDLVQQIRNTLLKLSTRNEEGRKVLGRLTNINGFVAVGDDHYDEVRRVERLVEQSEKTSP